MLISSRGIMAAVCQRYVLIISLGIMPAVCQRYALIISFGIMPVTYLSLCKQIRCI